jgi:hypothetical protein
MGGIHETKLRLVRMGVLGMPFDESSSSCSHLHQRLLISTASFVKVPAGPLPFRFSCGFSHMSLKNDAVTIPQMTSGQMASGTLLLHGRL